MENSGWELLGTLVRRRRENLGLKQGDLVQYGGPAVSTVGKIERAAQSSYPLRTQHQVENALGWKRGTVRSIVAAPTESWWEHEGLRDDFIEGLVEDNIPDLSHPIGGSASRAAELTDDELLAELTYRMKRYAAEREGDADGRRSAASKTSAGSAPADEIVHVDATVLPADEDAESHPAGPGQQPGRTPEG